MFIYYRWSMVIITLLCSITTYTMDFDATRYIPAAISNLPSGVYTYLRKLPKIKRTAESVDEKAKVIQEFLCEFSNSSVFPLTHTDKLEDKIKAYLQQNKPVACILLGFPAKSSNTATKVMASQCDMAEFTGLLTLNHMMHEIESIYRPGAIVQLYTREPFIYQMNHIARERLGIDLFKEGDIERYQAEVKKMVSLFYPYIQVAEVANVRAIYEEKYANLSVTVEDITGYKFFMAGELESDSVTEAAVSRLYQEKKVELAKKFKWAAQYDSFGAVKDAVSQQKLGKNKPGELKGFLGVKKYLDGIADQLAQIASKGALRMRALMNTHIPDYSSYVRLSIHAGESGDVSSKLGIGLIYESKGSPWHGTLGVSSKGVILSPLYKLKQDGEIQYYTIHDLSLGYMALS